MSFIYKSKYSKTCFAQFVVHVVCGVRVCEKEDMD